MTLYFCCLLLNLQVVVKAKGKGRVHRLTRSLRRLGRSVGIRKRDAIARQAMGDKKIRGHILNILGRDIVKELKGMCSIKKQSILCLSSPEALYTFDWDAICSELKSAAPSLFTILHSATTVKVPPSKVRKVSRRVKQEQIIGLCAAILLRHRNHSMNLVQRVLSV